ncbi:efflux RND transporter permease subunit [Butyrivibrio sp. MC2013]|uniref:efflux RND transporter permease subunit n=1 Tax=Butyrivibrio sp. MC2013 TaxID=1280686 RepID=UPI0003FB13D7|nr:efflux RND transporter permease subunit [Butyrivibrio sp. MC2013]
MSKYSVKKPFTVLVGVIVTIVLGIVSIMNMQLDLLPDISLPYLMVLTTYPGASSEKVEAEICEPMESALGTITGIKNVSSVCSENYGMVQLEFTDDTDLDSAMVKVSSALNTLSPYLPDDAGTPSIIELSTDMMASVYLAVSMEDMEMDELSQFVRDEITPYYEKQAGVASITTLGLVDKSVQVELNQDKVDALNQKILDSLEDRFADAQEQLDDAKDKLNDSAETIEENRKKLQDSQKELADGKQELIDGQAELDKNKAEFNSNKNELAQKKSDLTKGEQELNDKKNESNTKLADLSYQLDQASAQLATLQTQLTQAQAQKTQLGDALTKINDGLRQIDDGAKKIDDGIKQIDDGVSQLDTLLNSTSAEELNAGIETINGAITGIQAQIDALDPEEEGYNEQLAALQAQLTPLQAQLAELTATKQAYDAAPAQKEALLAKKAELESQKASLETKKTELKTQKTMLETQKQAADGTIAALTPAIAEAKGQVESAYKELEKAKLEAAESIGSADAQLQIGKTQLDSAQSQLDAAESQLDSAQEQINSGWEQLSDGQEQITEGWDQLSDGEEQLASGWDDYNDAVKSYEKQRSEAEKQANADKLLTLDALTGLIYAQNFEMPAGYVDDKQDNSWLVKVGQNYEEVSELENVVLTNINKVGDVKLGDVANITVIDNSADSYVKLSDKRAVILSIFKSSTAGTNDVSKTIDAASKELKAAHPGLTVTTLVDMGDYIDLIVKSVLQSMMIGAALAILILAIFLKDVKPTLVVAISIPVSVLAALVCMYFSNISLNMLSLSGLALGIGMLVDNSIVVIENIYRLRNRGIEAPRAAVQGAKQVAGAITASTLTTVCVFMPMIYTSGLVNDLLAPMCLTIVFCLLASLAIALTVVPAAGSTLLKNSSTKAHPLFDKAMKLYDRALRFCLKVKIVPLALAVLLLLFSGFMVIRMGIVVIPDMTMNQIQATIEYPEETTREEAYEQTDMVLDRLLQIDGIGSIGVLAGGDESLFVSSLASSSDNFRTMSFMMMTEDENAGDAEIRQIMSEIEGAVADMDVGFTLETMSSEMDQLTGGSGLSINVYGPDIEELKRISRDIMELTDSIDGYENISNGEEDSNKVLHLTIDKNKAMSLGLNVVQIYQDINSKLTHSKSAVTITIDGIDMDIVVVNDLDPLTYENILDYGFDVQRTDEDYDTVTETHKLREFATLEIADSLSSINRKNQSRYMTVTAEAAEGYNITLLTRKLQPMVEAYELPQGYSIEFSGEYDTVINMLKQMALVLLLGMLLVYMVMVAQFQSLLSPFIVMFTIPLAFTGGFLALWITRQNLSIISIMGIIVLMGTVVNNGIVFVDYVNQLRKQGLDRHTALIATGQTRMRPILMTALTTILAESNLIIGDDMGAQLGRGMALVIAGGLAYATLMTLFIIPVMYDIMFKKQPLDVDTGSDDLDDIPDDASEFLGLMMEDNIEDNVAMYDDERDNIDSTDDR